MTKQRTNTVCSTHIWIALFTGSHEHYSNSLCARLAQVELQTDVTCNNVNVISMLDMQKCRMVYVDS